MTIFIAFFAFIFFGLVISMWVNSNVIKQELIEIKNILKTTKDE
ncbi:MAG: hypothetical protein Q8920_15445 [Bacillota bacterium]|nr:hypothetical protein [Bacillota bacterium]